MMGRSKSSVSASFVISNLLATKGVPVINLEGVLTHWYEICTAVSYAD
jgi:hypothetical protein